VLRDLRRRTAVALASGSAWPTPVRAQKTPDPCKAVINDGYVSRRGPEQRPHPTPLVRRAIAPGAPRLQALVG
jgi:hypothetical protein